MTMFGKLSIVAMASVLFGCGGSGTGELLQKERNTVAVTQRSVLVGQYAILTILRDSVDGTWFCFPDEHPEVDPEVTLPLQEVVRIDSTVAQLRDLPVGWKATRKAKSAPWIRSRQ